MSVRENRSEYVTGVPEIRLAASTLHKAEPGLLTWSILPPHAQFNPPTHIYIETYKARRYLSIDSGYMLIAFPVVYHSLLLLYGYGMVYVCVLPVLLGVALVYGQSPGILGEISPDNNIVLLRLDTAWLNWLYRCQYLPCNTNT